MSDDSGEFSEGLDEFENSIDDKPKGLKNQTNFKDKPWDEAFEVSQDLSMAESFDGRDKQPNNPRERQLKNDKYDEAVEISQSLDQSNLNVAAAKPRPQPVASAKGSSPPPQEEAKGLTKKAEMSKSQSVLNNHHDEAMDLSVSGSEESVDTKGSSPGRHHHLKGASSNLMPNAAATASIPQMSAAQKAAASQLNTQDSPPTNNRKSNATGSMQPSRGNDEEHDEDSGEEEGDPEESYDNLDGAYNARDYQHLNVASEVRDLFQYIERYKPHEVQLEAPLRCFIPDYIPAIGELDAFIKVPRPDNKEDGLGLRFLDEPSANQSDPTVLELQLRAKSKKLQYGDVAVRSIEHADKNPSKIEKWVNDIRELHRSKPPPQVNYKKNMPDIDSLMEVWPEEFEQMLANSPLPSPDLDLSLGEYAKTLCAILDIPTYDNPIESLHLMFSLFIDFRNNPHFQARMLGGGAEPKNGAVAGHYGNNYGAADVLEIEQGEEYK